ncbi:hypothetical protein ACFRIC_09075 [Streptomyces sp. NPDC056738]|uniref:hypothetical protein n=1 Tax=Streptomyces sp. NPDC056738 TaxID=3345933 RepID=UPI00367A92A6
MSHRTTVGLSVACVAALLTVAACTSDHADAGRPSRPTHSSAPSAAVTTPPSTTEPPAQKPPGLDSGETLAGHQDVTSGSASIAFSEGRKSDALIVAVNCRGTGTIKVAVQSVKVSFPLDCVADEVNTTYNEVAVKGADRAGVVSVQAPSGVRWSMTIGRGTPAQEE